MCNCNENSHCNCQNNSGFIFGLIIGAIIAAIIAIVIYKNNKEDILSTLQSKLSTFFAPSQKFSKPSNKPSSKKPVILPEKILKSQILATSTINSALPKKPRIFLKPKK
jgi:hypothetical protein